MEKIFEIQPNCREELVHIKQGEENKRKIYRALCVINQPVTVDLLKKLNISEEFTINQITPIRVLHRRPWRNRQRKIFKVKATINKGETFEKKGKRLYPHVQSFNFVPHFYEDNHQMIVLDITTEAGTYIKELVHGEYSAFSISQFELTNLLHVNQVNSDGRVHPFVR